MPNFLYMGGVDNLEGLSDKPKGMDQNVEAERGRLDAAGFDSHILF